MAKPNITDKYIERKNIGDFCTDVMQIYAANVKYMRFIPGCIDGLKPVERRVLFAMFLRKLFYNKPYTKSNVPIGEAILYHPHGDGSIYDSIVRMAQTWINNQTLIDGQGNFGTPSGDNNAAHRYTEVRMSLYAYKCFFEDFNLDIVDTKVSFLGELLEPEYLPSRYPNVLINNTFGIGYGVSTGLPTYNPKEVLELTINLLDDPEYENVTLIPDSPTWAQVVDDGQFKALSEEGKGQFRMRGEMEVDEVNNIIKIKSTPLQVTANKVEAALLELQDAGKINGILDFKDYAGRETDNPSGFEKRIILKKEVDPYALMDLMYKSNTVRMQVTIPINFKLIDDYADINFNIRSLILRWIEFRRDYKRRVYNNLIIEVKERQHILDTILMVFNGKNAERALKTIRESENKAEIIKFLIEAFPITTLQAAQLADMKLSAFSKDSIRNYIKEKQTIDEKVEKYDKIIRSSKKIDKIIKEELEEGIKLFGTPRRSQIITADGKRKIRDTDHIIVFTRQGLVKKLPREIESIGTINQGDYPIEIMTDISNLTDLLIFDEKGMISNLHVHLMNNSEISAGGEKLSNYCKVNGNITSIIRKPTAESIEQIKAPVYFIMVTANGIVKKTLVSRYTNIKNELAAMIIKEGDTLKSVKLMVGTKDILIYTNKGFGVRFSSDMVKETNRMSIGVKAIDLNSDEVVIGMDIINDKDTRIFSLTNRGTGKTSTLDNFQTMDRASKPLRITTLEDDEEVILIKTVKGKERFKVYMKNGIEEINIADVMELPRLSKGRKLVNVLKGNMIIDIKEVK